MGQGMATVRFHIIPGNSTWCSKKPLGYQKAPFQHVMKDLLPSYRLAEANAVYHSACLIDAFALFRPDWRRLRRIEAEVLHQLAHVDSRLPIMVNSLRCHGFPHPQAQLAFPTLWKEAKQGGRFYRVCGQHHSRIPLRRSIYMPYLDTWFHRHSPLSNTRDRAVVFSGSLFSSHRKAVANAVQKTQGGEVVEYKSRSHRTVDFTRYEFVACAAGDTPESQRTMQAIVYGAIPLVEDSMYRFRFFDWDKISAPLRIDASGKVRLPSAQVRVDIRNSLADANRSFFNMSKWRSYVVESWRSALPTGS